MSSIFSNNVGRKALMLLVVLVCGLVFMAPVHAEEAEAKPAEGDIIGGLLDFGAWFTPFKRTNAFRGLQRELDDQTGIFVNLGATITWQMVSDAEEQLDDGGNPYTQKSLLNASYDLAGEWALVDADFGKGILKFGFDGGFNIGAKDYRNMTDSAGSLLGVNGDWENDALKVGSLYWAQTLLDNNLVVIIGRSSGDTFIDDNRVAADETSQFLADPFTGNPTVAGPGKGGTLAASYTINDEMYFSAGVSDSTAVSTQSGFDTLDDGRWFTSGEFGYATSFGDYAGTYRFFAWYTDIEDANGSGWGVSFDQELPGVDGLVGFFRAGWADGGTDIVDVDKFISGGLGIEAPYGREGDMAGIGIAWGDPAGGDRAETLIEGFYRYQINKFMEITPDVQWILNPGNSTANSNLLVGLRLQITYGGPES